MQDVHPVILSEKTVLLYKILFLAGTSSQRPKEINQKPGEALAIRDGSGMRLVAHLSSRDAHFHVIQVSPPE